MGSYSKKSAIKLITVLRTPLFAKFLQDRDNIFRLVREGNVDRLTQYLEAGGDPDLQGHWHVKTNRTEGYTVRWSLLCEGAAFGHDKVLQLLARAIGVNNVAKMSFALWIASYYGHLSLVKWLLENTLADVTKCPKSPLLTSAENSHFNVTKYLLDYIFDEKNNVTFSQVDLDAALSFVIARQADDGRLALHVAAETNDTDTVRWLCRSGNVNVDMLDNNGLTPLHIACQMGNNEVAELLVYYGANGLIRNDFGRSCVDVALAYSNQSLIDFMTTLWPGDNGSILTLNKTICQRCYNGAGRQVSNLSRQFMHWWSLIQMKLGIKSAAAAGKETFTVTDDVTSVSDWDVFIVIVDEVASRLLGRFRRGITFTKAADDRETSLNEIQFCQLGYKLLLGMRFGKSLVFSNVLKFWEESLNRLLSLVIGRRQNNDVLVTNQALILQAINLLRKLLKDEVGLLTAVTGQRAGEETAEQQFERSAVALFDLTKRLSVDNDALNTVLPHLQQLYSLASDSGTAGTTVDVTYENSDIGVNDSTFSKADTELLLLTIAKIHRGFLRNVDLRILCSIWAAFIAFFAHVKQLENQKQPPNILFEFVVKAITSIAWLLWKVIRFCSVYKLRLRKCLDFSSTVAAGVVIAVIIGLVVQLYWLTPNATL